MLLPTPITAPQSGEGKSPLGPVAWLILWPVLKTLPTRGVWWDRCGYLKGLPSSQPPECAPTHTAIPNVQQKILTTNLMTTAKALRGDVAQGEGMAEYPFLHKYHITCLVPIRSQFLMQEPYHCRHSGTAGLRALAALWGETRARHQIPQVKCGTARERPADAMPHAAQCLFAKKPASVSALRNQQPTKLRDMSYICFVLLFSFLSSLKLSLRLFTPAETAGLAKSYTAGAFAGEQGQCVQLAS